MVPSKNSERYKQMFQEIFAPYNRHLAAIGFAFKAHKKAELAYQQAEEAYQAALVVVNSLAEDLRTPATNLLNNIARSFAWDVEEVDEGCSKAEWFFSNPTEYLSADNSLWECTED